MFSFCVLVSDKVPPPLPPSTLVQWNPALRSGLVIAAIFLGSPGKTAIHFLVKKTFVNTVIRRPIFFWPKSCFEVSIDMTAFLMMS